MRSNGWEHRLVSDGDYVQLSEVHYVDGEPWAYSRGTLIEQCSDDELDVKDGFRNQIDLLLSAIDKPILCWPKDFKGKLRED